jgi:hypothetical protein
VAALGIWGLHHLHLKEHYRALAGLRLFGIPQD